MTEKQAWLKIAEAFESGPGKENFLTSSGLCRAVTALFYRGIIDFATKEDMLITIRIEQNRFIYFLRRRGYLWPITTTEYFPKRAKLARKFAAQCEDL